MNEMSKIATDEALPGDATPRRSWRLPLLLSVPLVLLAAGLWFWLSSGRTVTTDNAVINAPVASIAPEVSGRIVEVAVKENQVVRAGDLLFRIDPAPYRIALLQAQAALGNARVQYAELQSVAAAKGADIATKAAGISSAAADVELARENFARQEALLKRGFTTRANYDSARAALASARQGRAAAVAERNSAQSMAASASAALGTGPNGEPPMVGAAMAQIAKAELDLKRTEVRAPMAGRVTQTDRLQPGNMAPQSLPVVSIVGNGGYWVEANFKETQLAKVRVGQPATVKIDALPGHSFAARVSGIGAGTGSQFSLLPAQNATGNWVKVTQRVPVRLKLEENPGQPLVAGWSAKVTVRVAD